MKLYTVPIRSLPEWLSVVSNPSNGFLLGQCGGPTRHITFGFGTDDPGEDPALLEFTGLVGHQKLELQSKVLYGAETRTTAPEEEDSSDEVDIDELAKRRAEDLLAIIFKLRDAWSQPPTEPVHILLKICFWDRT